MPEFYPSGPWGLLTFLLLTVTLGGAAAWATGRALARTWRPVWQLVVYMGLLTLAVRFLHYGLYREPFLPPAAVAIDFLVLVGFAALGFRVARARQMIAQYPWLYRAAGPLMWQSRNE
ncbi:MAG: hypothetical protein NW205_05195 [Hyphomicrobiaceae bacterium]|nr:hypothetical protein [Hyphomicrobiaceae bacterium]